MLLKLGGRRVQPLIRCNWPPKFQSWSSTTSLFLPQEKTERQSANVRAILLFMREKLSGSGAMKTGPEKGSTDPFHIGSNRGAGRAGVHVNKHNVSFPNLRHYRQPAAGDRRRLDIPGPEPAEAGDDKATAVPKQRCGGALDDGFAVGGGGDLSRDEGMDGLAVGSDSEGV